MNIEKIRFRHVLLFVTAILILLRFASTALESKKRNDLAKKLGIDRNEYVDTSSFPANYFFRVLRPDFTTITEVHEIVREYELVLHCSRESEVYYYYSKYEDDALRFQIVYDEGKYQRLIGEDDDSNTLYTENCVPGLLGENLQ